MRSSAERRTLTETSVTATVSVTAAVSSAVTNDLVRNVMERQAQIARADQSSASL